MFSKIVSYVFPSYKSTSSQQEEEDNVVFSKQGGGGGSYPVVSQQDQNSASNKPKPTLVNYDVENLPTITHEIVEGVPECFILRDVLTPNECTQFLHIIEQMGKKSEDNISECKFWKASPEIMRPIWARVAPFLPEELDVDEEGLGKGSKKWEIVTENPMNEKFRFYTYDAEWVRERHFDGCFLRSNGAGKRDQSHFTFLIYLNDGFDGGETTFYPGGTNSLDPLVPATYKEVRVNPRTGSALFFRQTGNSKPLHEGSIHHSPGLKKCLIRSDVMYSEK